MEIRLRGLIAATYTPMDDKGRLRLEVVPRMVERLLAEGLSGLYVCGSTGEGMSLSSSERREVAAAFVESAGGRVPVVVQVGHNSLREAAALASHARQIGADAISACAPSYFKIHRVSILVECLAEIAAAAGGLPFYYYHIPALTGVSLDVVQVLQQAGERIANLAGMKYTHTAVHEYQACCQLENGRFDVLWGCDEMLLSALAVGARGAVGSTYNIAAPLYRRIMGAFRAGQWEEARHWQEHAVRLIRTLSLSEQQLAELRRELDRIGFFQWARPGPA